MGCIYIKRKLHLVDWEAVSKPIDRQGLGIVRLKDLNAVLIVKCIYKFVNERYSLWGKVLSARSEVDSNRMLPLVNKSSMKSVLFNLIRIMLDRNDRASKLIHQGFRPLIGNGFNVNFLSDD